MRRWEALASAGGLIVTACNDNMDVTGCARFHVRTMEDEGVIQTEGRDKPFCSVCGITLASDNSKAIKQHLKSKTHKQSQKLATAPIVDVPPKHPTPETEDSEEVVESELEDEPCELCCRLGKTDTRHSLQTLKAALERGEEVRPCLPPPFVRSPKSLFPGCSTPFISLESGSIPEVPDDLEECIDLYCNAGANDGNKPPNIDINGENCKAKSLSNARRTLLQAQSSDDLYWAALVVDAIAHPVWWPRPRDKVCVGEGDVPNFNQVIIGNGPTDIGIHIDNAPRPGHNCCSNRPVQNEQKLDFVDVNDPQYNFCLSAGEDSVHVHTYITMARGKKYVIMLPPGKNFFEPKTPFPREVGLELMGKIQDAGGYYFALEPVDDTQHVTLFTPKGWHHWLLGASEWHVIFGASRF